MVTNPLLVEVNNVFWNFKSLSINLVELKFKPAISNNGITGHPFLGKKKKKVLF
jgi:hypothetical protein